MSAKIKLSSRLPGDPEINGLDSLYDELLLDPEQIVCALTWIKVKDIRRLIEVSEGEPDEIVTALIARIEPIDVVDRVPADVITLADQLHEKRTGKRALPFDQIVGAGDAVVYSTADRLDYDDSEE